MLVDGGVQEGYVVFGAQGIHGHQVLVEHLAIEEQEGTEGLALCRSITR